MTKFQILGSLYMDECYEEELVEIEEKAKENLQK